MNWLRYAGNPPISYGTYMICVNFQSNYRFLFSVYT